VYINTLTLIAKVDEVRLQSFDEAPESSCPPAYLENEISDS
jgi:hypothetical protein